MLLHFCYICIMPLKKIPKKKQRQQTSSLVRIGNTQIKIAEKYKLHKGYKSIGEFFENAAVEYDKILTSLDN